MSEAIDLTAGPVEITRVLTDYYSVSKSEGPLADAIEAVLGALPHLSVDRLGNTVVARTNLGRDRRVVLAGHIDTVPVNGNHPSRYEERDGTQILWGRGTVDMKGGCAVFLALAAELTDPAVDLTYVFYECEEIDPEHNGLQILAEERPEWLQGDFAVLGEPTGGCIEGGCNGYLTVDIVTRGEQAHSARSWVGRNAIHAASDVLRTLAEFEAETHTVDGLDYREGLNAVAIRGGVANNVIPDECRVTVNYRFAPRQSADEALAWVSDMFAEFSVERLEAVDGARPGLTDPLAEAFVAASGKEPRAKLGWTDVARFTSLGIPAVNYGPGDPLLCHTADEHQVVDDIVAAHETVRTWLHGLS